MNLSLCRFVYTEHADISRLDELAPDNGKVFELLYLAKKYLLEELVGYIVSYFVAILSVPNVFSVFRHSHFFDNGFLVECVPILLRSTRYFYGLGSGIMSTGMPKS